ncbi:Rhodanese domain protein [Isosphaera pallida ATCC 43644]|jgi:rhodanese-related sulfurtransferase|uniref:Rhodanese domain protein n=1 Tax=Isosphaera pallida (strain ATCC 43644 / DSM 9630 / IS1B) TaxID=575540 RepID=E8R0A0_ISOPI|nr:rhodanese-like domain-containing protein [Isosphaera pallida]ADV62227.1 Rhodanese domain protein [Isosphaera pallida ATCC 43644]
MSADLPFRTLTPIELKRRLDGSVPLIVLDVREHSERALCKLNPPPPHMDQHLPLTAFAEGWNALRERLTQPDHQGRPIVVYCHHGVRSQRVAEFLGANGLAPVYNLQGGIDAWAVEVDPTVTRY